MSDLATQLRTYFDTVDPPFALDEVLPRDALSAAPSEVGVEEHGRPRVDHFRPRRSRPRWGVALAALVATLLVVGGALVLLRPAETEVVDEPTSTTVPATTTTVVEPSPTTTSPGPVPPGPVPATGFAVIPIDTEGIVGKAPAIAVAADGIAVMAYLGHREVNVAVCADAACTSVESVVTIAEGSVSPEDGPAVAVLPDGRPVIVYGLGTGQGTEEPPPPEPINDLLLTVCDDPGCSTWTTTVIAEQLVLEPEITATADGRPMIAFFQQESDSADLRLAVCDDSACSGFSTATVYEGSGWHGGVALAPGDPPAFAYMEEGEVRLATCSDASCGDITSTLIEGISNTPVMTRASGRVVMVTVAEGTEGEGEFEPTNDITVLTCGDAGCTDLTSTVIGRMAGSSMLDVATDPAGHPVFAYNEYESGLTVARCNDPLCMTGVTTGNPAGWNRHAAALAIGSDGNPLLAFHTGSDLVLIRCADPACVDVPPPAPAPEPLSFSDPGWVSTVAADEALDSPGPAVVFDADGLPVIIHQAPTGGLGPEGETESGLAVTSCADAACSQTTAGDALAIDLGWGNAFVLDGEGLPVAAFWSWGAEPMLGYARCDDANCSAATRTELHAADGWARPDAAVRSDGLVVMAFQNYTFNPGPIQVAFCVDDACSSVDVVDLDYDCVDESCESFWVHNTVSLALTPDDRPVVVYTSSSGRTRLVVCDDPRCGTFSASTLDDTGSDSEAARVAVGTDGNPIVGYYADGTAKLAFCLDSSCAAVTVAQLGESARDLWTKPQVAALGDGRVAVAYWGPSSDLRLAVCSYPCDERALSTLVDVTSHYSMSTAPDGLPLIAYVEGAQHLDEPPHIIPGRLVVAKCTDAVCVGS